MQAPEDGDVLLFTHRGRLLRFPVGAAPPATVNSKGRVYDVWITFGSVHEVRAFRERKKRSLWVRGLVENCVGYGDRGYRGCEGVIVVEGFPAGEVALELLKRPPQTPFEIL